MWNGPLFSCLQLLTFFTGGIFFLQKEQSNFKKQWYTVVGKTPQGFFKDIFSLQIVV